MKKLHLLSAVCTFTIAIAGFMPFSVHADSIAPVSYSDTLGLGDSVTIRKTVTITEGSPTTAPLDVMFLFDTTGSMGAAIDQAKAAANDILTGLSGFGNLFSGTGYYNDPAYNGVYVDLNSGNTGVTSGIADMADPFIGYVGGVFIGSGGDYAEQTYAGISDTADNSSWRTGSTRFIITLGDAPTHEPPSAADTIASLTAENVNLFGIDYGYDGLFSADITGVGGTALIGAGLDTDALVDLIIASVGSAFDEYSTVTVDDLGGGLPGIAVSTECVSADAGACVGADAIGAYDRSTERNFEFDVTFTALAEGEHNFDTYALADGGIIAAEADSFTVSTVPVPAAVWLFGSGLLGLVGIARRKKAA